MYFNENEISRIKSASDGRLLDVVQDFRELRKSGKDYVCECPKCRSAKKFTVSPGKNLFKCFSCQIGGEGAVSYLMNIEGYGYTDALEYLAKKFCVFAGPPSGQTSWETGPEDEEGKQGCQRAGYGFLLRPNAGRLGTDFRGCDRQCVQDR
ncbi:CHC2 zinc finger domain-containing protein [Phocaeicola vulgatus]|nr:CHC2 zinc finger domain-containing protein [Phocaeicola vulgatus]